MATNHHLMKTFFFYNVLSGDVSSVKKIKELIKLSFYYLKLQWGTITGQIFFKLDQESKSNVLMFDKKKMLSEIDDWIRSIVRRNSQNNYVDISKNIGFEHIAYGCFVTHIFGRPLIITQGEAIFFFRTYLKHSYIIRIKIASIIRVTIKVKIENSELIQMKLPSLTERVITLKINPDLIVNEITKITISTNELWSPHFIDKTKYDIPMGVGIERIELTAGSEIS